MTNKPNIWKTGHTEGRSGSMTESGSHDALRRMTKMNLDNFQSFLRKKPFMAFVIHTASGESYEVNSPESVMVSPDQDVIVTFTREGHVAMLGISHITEVMYPVEKAKKRGKQG
jgi:hypothetical protein